MSGRPVLTVVHPHLRAWGSGHDAAVHRLVAALAARGDVAVRVVTARVHGEVPPGVAEVVRLPAIPLWHFSLLFLSFRLAWSLWRRWKGTARQGTTYLGSPLLGGGDLAAVHFLSLDFLALDRHRAAPSGLPWRLRMLHDRFRHALAAPLERRAYGRAAAGEGPRLLPVSDGLAHRLERCFGPLPGLEVVPNIVDATRFCPGAESALAERLRAAAGWPSEWPIVLFVGGAWQRKGLPVAVAALALLAARGVDAGLLVVGPGPRAALAEQASALGIGGRVHAVGAVADTAPYYRVADALVLPSSYETDSLVAWEALASGIPVVAAPFAGCNAWLRDGETALAAQGPEDTATALARLLGDAALRARFGAAGRALALERGGDAVAARVVGLSGMGPVVGRDLR